MEVVKMQAINIVFTIDLEEVQMYLLRTLISINIKSYILCFSWG